MHSSSLSTHLAGEIPKVIVKEFKGFHTVDITFDKFSIQFFFDNEQELINFKNNLLWAFEKPVKM
jgi:hypothetical protein